LVGGVEQPKRARGVLLSSIISSTGYAEKKVGGKNQKKGGSSRGKDRKEGKTIKEKLCQTFVLVWSVWP